MMPIHSRLVLLLLISLLTLMLGSVNQYSSVNAAALLNDPNINDNVPTTTTTTTTTSSTDDNEERPVVRKSDTTLGDDAQVERASRPRICKSCFWLPTCDKVSCTEPDTECIETPQECSKCGTAKCYPKKRA